MTIYYPQPTISESTGFYYNSKIINITDCPILPPNFAGSQGALWNSNLCEAERQYSQLFKSSDVIPIQLYLFDLVNEDIENPAIGFNDSEAVDYFISVELYDITGALISDNVADFCSDYYVRHNELGSYQTFFVDCSLINVDEFYLIVNTYDTEYEINQSVISEPFKRVTNEETLEFVGFYNDRDGYNRTYKEATNTAFYSFFRCEAAIFLNALNSENTEADNDTIVSTDITESYSLQAWLLPPYALRLLSLACFAQKTTIDSVEYTNIQTLEKSNSDGRMFFVETTANIIDKINHYNC